MSNPALVRLQNKKPGSKPAPRPTLVKKTAPTTHAPRAPHPWGRIKQMYDAGKSWNEISETLKIKRSSMNGISDRLVVGVTVNGTTYKIVRGKKRKK